MRVIFALGALLTLASCATVRPGLVVHLAGALDMAASSKVSQAAVERADPTSIPVYDAKLTDLNMKDYEVLASVAVRQHSDDSLRWRNAFWYNDFEQRGRFGYCVWQVPFKIVTLSLWNALPLAWPCFAGNPSSPEDRLAYLMSYARRTAAALGGDAVLLKDTADTRSYVTHEVGVEPVPGLYVPVASTSTENIDATTSATFVILRKRK